MSTYYIQRLQVYKKNAKYFVTSIQTHSDQGYVPIFVSPTQAKNDAYCLLESETKFTLGIKKKYSTYDFKIVLHEESNRYQLHYKGMPVYILANPTEKMVFSQDDEFLFITTEDSTFFEHPISNHLVQLSTAMDMTMVDEEATTPTSPEEEATITPTSPAAPEEEATTPASPEEEATIPASPEKEVIATPEEVAPSTTAPSKKKRTRKSSKENTPVKPMSVEEPVIPVTTPMEEPVTVEPVTEEPVTEEPVIEEPVTVEPVTEEPVTVEPVTEEPVAEEPVAEEPVTEEPVTEEPVMEEPVAEEPVTEEPVMEEPVAEEPATEEPVTEEPTKEEFVMEEEEEECEACKEEISRSEGVPRQTAPGAPVIFISKFIYQNRIYQTHTMRLEPNEGKLQQIHPTNFVNPTNKRDALALLFQEKRVYTVNIQNQIYLFTQNNKVLYYKHILSPSFTSLPLMETLTLGATDYMHFPFLHHSMLVPVQKVKAYDNKYGMNRTFLLPKYAF